MTVGTLLASIGLACAGLLPVLCAAQDYPSRSIQLIVPSSPGTRGDHLARLLGPKLSQRWNVPVVVDNKVGAGGMIGMEAGAKASPDGYTFLFSGTAFTTLPALRQNLPYDPIKSFSSVVLLGSNPLVLVVTNSVPAKTVREFIDYVKKQPPGKLNYASPGLGSVHHLTMELFKQQTGLYLTHIPYRGTGGALNDLVAGHVEASVVGLSTVLTLVQSGKIRMLAVLAPQRVAQFPNVPTLAEAGIQNMVIESWTAITAPVGTPPAVIAKMNSEINSLLALPEVKESMEKMGLDPAGGKPEKLDVLVRSELEKWRQVVKKGNITAD